MVSPMKSEYIPPYEEEQESIPVVFTGTAVDSSGMTMTRDEFTKLVEYHGFRVQPKVTGDTRYLVASRLDTTKADAARKLGVEVITYPDFFDRFL